MFYSTCKQVVTKLCEQMGITINRSVELSEAKELATPTIMEELVSTHSGHITLGRSARGPTRDALRCADAIGVACSSVFSCTCSIPPPRRRRRSRSPRGRVAAMLALSAPTGTRCHPRLLLLRRHLEMVLVHSHSFSPALRCTHRPALFDLRHIAARPFQLLHSMMCSRMEP